MRSCLGGAVDEFGGAEGDANEYGISLTQLQQSTQGLKVTSGAFFDEEDDLDPFDTAVLR
eukprot:CAMPEP_0204269394 /NCGR_PEP_ID=MMETSP0468-20130131/16009_1 /ASSEMBLY_ACC=CAM_ASM_000383 /TAXON_ID=2969 /ORGANISM="Oxyrrhis marina" /LENGTH=59 /DNA_ID=CAMNT_0051244773 /DNA_START=141 /DNA_END=320 /DNA_ORIENTATION=-